MYRKRLHRTECRVRFAPPISLRGALRIGCGADHGLNLLREIFHLTFGLVFPPSALNFMIIGTPRNPAVGKDLVCVHWVVILVRRSWHKVRLMHRQQYTALKSFTL